MNGKDVSLRAVVALLTRNIKIEGQNYIELLSESFGARVLVGENLFTENGETISHSGEFLFLSVLSFIFST